MDEEIPPPRDVLAAAERFLGTYAAVNSTETGLLADLLLTEYNRRGRALGLPPASNGTYTSGATS
jgi:hypothetical protein